MNKIVKFFYLLIQNKTLKSNCLDDTKENIIPYKRPYEKEYLFVKNLCAKHDKIKITPDLFKKQYLYRFPNSKFANIVNIDTFENTLLYKNENGIELSMKLLNVNGFYLY